MLYGHFEFEDRRKLNRRSASARWSLVEKHFWTAHNAAYVVHSERRTKADYTWWSPIN
jgi:hypothetical protein